MLPVTATRWQQYQAFCRMRLRLEAARPLIWRERHRKRGPAARRAGASVGSHRVLSSRGCPVQYNDGKVTQAEWTAECIVWRVNNTTIETAGKCFCPISNEHAYKNQHSLHFNFEGYSQWLK